MSTEAAFWGRIVTGCWAPDRLLNRIENGVLDGMPDCYTVINGVANWLELKCPSTPSRPGTALFSGAHKLSPTQRNWLLAHRQAGGRGWVGIETDGWVLLIGAQHADVVNTSTLNQLLLRAAFGEERPMKPEHWTQFINTLTNRKLKP